MSQPHYVDQGTAAWWKLRRGIPTASQFERIITPTGKPSSQARGYMYELVAERLLGETMDTQRRGVTNQWVEHGINNEHLALKKFAEEQNMTLIPIGFVTATDGRSGCSPDALVEGSHEAVEIKCRAPWNHIGYLLDGMGNDYRPQVQGQLYVGEWDIAHFYAYHPQCPSFYIKTLRDKDYIHAMDDLLNRFNDTLDELTEKARALGGFKTRDERGDVIDLPGVAPWR